MDANNVKNTIAKIRWPENELSNQKLPIELIKEILSLRISK
jgi:hypothetical protein